MRTATLMILATMAAGLLHTACGDDATGANDGVDPGDSDSGPWVGDSDSTVVTQPDTVQVVDADGNEYICHETICDGRLLECGDCVDNDGDGKVDWNDRECLGPCDNTEGPALISDVGGVTGSTCHVDCYFDYGNGTGTGSDDCWWDHQCDPLEPESTVCAYDSTMASNQHFCPTEQSPLCEEICLPFTPNGCDCFGCCTFPELDGLADDGGPAYVWIGAKDADNAGICTFDDILDESRCPRCTPVENCFNTCDTCEICIGKPTLPPECYEGGDTDGIPEGLCPDGVEPCDFSAGEPCSAGFYCVSGCCRPTVLIE